MNILTAISSAAEILQQAGVAEPRKEAASLLAEILNKNTAFFVAHPENELSTDELHKFNHYVARRAKREPFQYIVGRQEFYGLEFIVTPDVLIPRPETEILVEKAVEILSTLENPRFCEIGVGSGCISVAILANVATATAISIDISEAALKIARLNAERHNVDERLNLLKSDVFSHVDGKYDLIASNPPYIPAVEIDSLQAEVRGYEPRSALDGGGDGLAIIQKIIGESPEYLNSRGSLILEIGFDQSEKVRPLFAPTVWKTPEFFADLQGFPRIVTAEMRPEQSSSAR